MIIIVITISRIISSIIIIISKIIIIIILLSSLLLFLFLFPVLIKSRSHRCNNNNHYSNHHHHDYFVPTPSSPTLFLCPFVALCLLLSQFPFALHVLFVCVSVLFLSMNIYISLSPRVVSVCLSFSAPLRLMSY